MSLSEPAGDLAGLYHHHSGVGDYDPAVLDTSCDELIVRKLERLETAQANVLLDHLGPITVGDRLLDGGCGFGGTSFLAHHRFGCRVDGVTSSEAQVAYATEQAARRGCADRVRFHARSMLDTGFPAHTFQAGWTNETTRYVDLFQLFAELARTLRDGGRYVCVTGCYNDILGGPTRPVREINEHYLCHIHPRGEYFAALHRNGFVPITVVDLTASTIPYWQLRARSALRTGIEDPLLTAYRDGSLHYLLIAADRTTIHS